MLKMHDDPMSTHSSQSQLFFFWVDVAADALYSSTKQANRQRKRPMKPLQRLWKVTNSSKHHLFCPVHVQCFLNLWTNRREKPSGSDAYWNIFDFIVIGVSVVEPCRIFATTTTACWGDNLTTDLGKKMGEAKDVVLDFWARMLSPSMSTGQLRLELGRGQGIWHRKWIGREVWVWKNEHMMGLMGMFGHIFELYVDQKSCKKFLRNFDADRLVHYALQRKKYERDTRTIDSSSWRCTWQTSFDMFRTVFSNNSQTNFAK